MLKLCRAFLWLELHMLRKYRFALAVEIVEMFVVLFGISRLPLDPAANGALGGGGYAQFVMTGLVYQLFFDGIAGGPSGRLQELQVSGMLQTVLAAPYPRWLVLLAAGVSSMLEGLLRAVCVLALGIALFGFGISGLQPAHLAVAFLFTAALGTLVALVNVAGLLLWPRARLSALFSSLVVGLLSGVFVPIAWLPEILRRIADVNPLRWGLETFRTGLGMSFQSAPPPGGAPAALAGLLIGGIVAVYLYRHADARLVRENRYQSF